MNQEGIDWDAFLEQALHGGMTAEAFWRATPKEASLTIEAAGWRSEQQDKRAAWTAWLTAKLTRAKRMPSWKRLMGEPETKVLKGEELERRRQERGEMMEQMDLDKLNEAMRSR